MADATREALLAISERARARKEKEAADARDRAIIDADNAKEPVYARMQEAARLRDFENRPRSR